MEQAERGLSEKLVQRRLMRGREWADGDRGPPEESKLCCKLSIVENFPESVKPKIDLPREREKGGGAHTQGLLQVLHVHRGLSTGSRCQVHAAGLPVVG